RNADNAAADTGVLESKPPENENAPSSTTKAGNAEPGDGALLSLKVIEDTPMLISI
ncbi:unnamed protein product, partial [Amoebophrya sp. A25]